MSHKLPCVSLAAARATSDGEEKVIITGGIRDGECSSTIISFDLKNGFEDIDGFEMDSPVSSHVALPLM